MVLAVLREYSRAHERMDVRATKAVYPSVDDRRLRRAFDDLQEQQVRFASCGVTISSSGAGANAWCKGDASFRPRSARRSTIQIGNGPSAWPVPPEGGTAWQILNSPPLYDGGPKDMKLRDADRTPTPPRPRQTSTKGKSPIKGAAGRAGG